MKNLHILLFSAILLANPTFSQIKQTKSIVSTQSIEATNAFNAPQLRSSQDDSNVIWCEDFENGLAGNNNSDTAWTTSGSDGALWLYDTDGPSGQFSTIIGALESTTADDGWMIFDADLSNPGQVQAQFVDRVGQLTSPYIDLSGEENVSLRFDHSYRWCCTNEHRLLVGVSVNQGETWTEFQINEDAVANEWVMTTQTTIIISDIAGGQDSVLIRFDWGAGEQTATNYFWMVDDVTIFETPARASTLGDAFVRLPSEYFGSSSYSNVPLVQAQVTGFFFGGNIVNEGSEDLVNARIVGEVEGNNFSDQSVNATISTNTDSVLFTVNGFIPTATGNYVGNVYGTDDNNTTTSTSQLGFIVTEFEYAKDLSDFSNSGVFANVMVNNNGTTRIGNSFEIYSSQDLYAIRVYIDMETAADAQANVILNSLNSMGEFNYETESEMVDVGQMRGEWVDFIFTSPYPTFEGQILVATIQADGNDPLVAIGQSGIGNPGDSYLQDLDGTQPMGQPGAWYRLNNNAMVRLNFDPSLEVVDPTSVNDVFLSEFLVYPNPNNGEFNLEIETKNSTDIVVSISNTLGQEVYNRELSNVTQFKSSIDVSYLQTGIYILQLHDNEGVIATEKLIVE